MAQADLFRLGDHAAGDARRSTGAGAASDGVNDDRGSAIAEKRSYRPCRESRSARWCLRGPVPFAVTISAKSGYRPRACLRGP